MHCKTDAPDNQTYITANDKYIRDEDKIIPQITGADTDIPTRIHGIDISAHNGIVDWNKIKSSGKKFAFIRVGWAGWDGHIEANGGLDKRFHENIKGAIEAGMDVGVYVYSYCKTPIAARIAARETLELVRPYKLTYPIAFDIEDTSDSGVRYDKMGRADNTAIVTAFRDIIDDAGYYSILYTYKDFAERYLDMSSFADWDVWIAQYANECTYNGVYGIWQYAGETGKCDGVTGACDLNIAYKDYAASRLNNVLPDAPDSSELKRLREENDMLKEALGEFSARNAELAEKLRQINQLSA